MGVCTKFPGNYTCGCMIVGYIGEGGIIPAEKFGAYGKNAGKGAAAKGLKAVIAADCRRFYS